jgi:hypothetical protein
MVRHDFRSAILVLLGMVFGGLAAAGLHHFQA